MLRRWRPRRERPLRPLGRPSERPDLLPILTLQRRWFQCRPDGHLLSVRDECPARRIDHHPHEQQQHRDEVLAGANGECHALDQFGSEAYRFDGCYACGEQVYDSLAEWLKGFISRVLVLVSHEYGRTPSEAKVLQIRL